MTCERCEKLEEQVAYLRSELGEISDAMFLSNIKLGFDLTPGQARLAELLYRANGRIISRHRLSDLLGVEGSSNIVSVYLTSLRRQIGADAFAMAWGQGISMTAVGRQRVEAIQGEQVAA